MEDRYVLDKMQSLEMEIKSLEKDMRQLELEATKIGGRQSGFERRITSLEDTLKWVVRIVLGAVILALLGTVIQSGGL